MERQDSSVFRFFDIKKILGGTGCAEAFRLYFVCIPFVFRLYSVCIPFP